MKNALVILLVFAVFTVQGQSDSFPRAVGYVNDFDGVLSPVEIRALQDYIEDYREKSGRKISVVTVNSIQPYPTMQEYATSLANSWRTDDNALLILVNNKENMLYVATGSDTEKILPEEICNSIVEKTILPEFRNGNYYRGLKNGLEALTYQLDIRTAEQ